MNDETFMDLLNKLNRMSESMYGAKVKVEEVEVSDDKDTVSFRVQIAETYKEVMFGLPDGNFMTLTEWDK